MISFEDEVTLINVKQHNKAILSQICRNCEHTIDTHLEQINGQAKAGQCGVSTCNCKKYRRKSMNSPLIQAQEIEKEIKNEIDEIENCLDGDDNYKSYRTNLYREGMAKAKTLLETCEWIIQEDTWDSRLATDMGLRNELNQAIEICRRILK